MKIRNGFVSNSSSSSFLIYGFRFRNGDEGEKLFEKIEELNDGGLYEYITPTNQYEDEYIIGYTIAFAEGTEAIDLDISNLEEKKQKTIDVFKKEGIDFSDRKFSFILGSDYC